MGLLNKFLQNGSEYGAGLGGNSANLQSERDAIIGNLKQSKLHDEYSITGNPSLTGLPNPANLDLNAQIPTIAGHGNITPGASTQALPYVNNEPG